MPAARALLEQVFRTQRPALLAAMTRAFGPKNLDLIEAALQDAFLAAAEEWPRTGAPDRPDAWILTVARNRALDQLRREGTSRSKAPALRAARTEEEQAHSGEDTALERLRLPGEIADDELQMIFVACHPCLSLESQIALTLRTLCGMEIDEITRALLSDEQAVAKRLVRARQALRDAQVELVLPPETELAQRLEGVARVLNLLFNEGYASLKGSRHIRGGEGREDGFGFGVDPDAMKNVDHGSAPCCSFPGALCPVFEPRTSELPRGGHSGTKKKRAASTVLVNLRNPLTFSPEKKFERAVLPSAGFWRSRCVSLPFSSAPSSALVYSRRRSLLAPTASSSPSRTRPGPW